ncbi:MAG: hypothetical protein JWQ10_3685 [Herbaspirillum sp.]|nr:hypothetical protein [Herbaspirillum sp.]
MPLGYASPSNPTLGTFYTVYSAAAVPKAIQSSRAKTHSFNKISRTNLELFSAADKCGNALDWVTRSNNLESLLDEWRDAVTGGNPNGKTLYDLTTILCFFYRSSRRQKGAHIFLASNLGNVRIRTNFWGRLSVYTRACNNFREYYKEKHSRFNNEMTLTVMRALYSESVVQNFLSGR